MASGKYTLSQEEVEDIRVQFDQVRVGFCRFDCASLFFCNDIALLENSAFGFQANEFDAVFLMGKLTRCMLNVLLSLFPIAVRYE